jgi:hypothetical protein
VSSYKFDMNTNSNSSKTSTRQNKEQIELVRLIYI